MLSTVGCIDDLKKVDINRQSRKCEHFQVQNQLTVLSGVADFFLGNKRLALLKHEEDEIDLNHRSKNSG